MQRIKYRGKDILPVKYDLVFKAVFVGDGDLGLLASLLSCILELDLKAEDLFVMNTEIPPPHETGKLSCLDIRVKTADNKHINVEIQLRNEHDMDKRSLFYLSKLYASQVTSEMRYNEICPAIAINILDFNYLGFEEYHNRYRMRNTRNNHELTDVFEINFIELPKVPRGVSDDLKLSWMRFLRADNEEVLDMLTNQSTVMEKAVKKLISVSADEKLRFEIEMREKAEMDYRSSINASYREGKIDAAKIMLADGEEIDRISKWLQLSIEEIAAIQREML